MFARQTLSFRPVCHRNYCTAIVSEAKDLDRSIFARSNRAAASARGWHGGALCTLLPFPKMTLMVPLPIDASIAEIISRVREARALVLVAPPGAGKTTRVPPALLRAALLDKDHPNLVMLQPRRVAARAAAQRIADENGWQLGREVGYHVRFDRKLGDATRLRVITEGILNRQLIDDPFLEGVGAVLLDEFHERSLHTDIAIALLKEVRQTVRPDLILVVMSATLEAEPVARFLGHCPIVRTEGRTFPIDIRYSPQPAGMQGRLPERTAEAVERIIGQTPGAAHDDVLVFLPGAEEIRRTARELAPFAERHDLLVLPLHGSLPAEEQTLALRPSNRRKVILATNIAETSLTINGVTTVIDTGLARVPDYDPQRGLDRLELKRISKASATQRAGRAGRTAPGRCVRLWSEKEQHALDDFELPEVRRVDLAGTVLALHAWGKDDPRSFGWYEPPGEETLAAAERLLAMLGALSAEKNGSITPLGRRLVAVPAHPRLARLLIAAVDEGIAEHGAALAALLSEKDIVASAPPQGREARHPKTQGPSDLLTRMELLAEAERARFAPHLRDAGIDGIAARQVAKVRDDLLRIAGRIERTMRGEARRGWHENDDAEASLLKLALLAYPDRVCRRREKDRAAGIMVGGGGVRLAAESVVRQPEFFLALDARSDQRSFAREALVRIASGIEEEWLEELFPYAIRRERSVVFDEDRQRVVGRGTAWYRDLLLKEDRDAAVDTEQASAVLAEALRPRAAQLFAANEESASLLARVSFLRKWVPEHPWPAFDDAQLTDLIAEAAHGQRSAEGVQRALAAALRNQLVYPLSRLLDEHAPEAIEVPSGNRIHVTYGAGEKPVLMVRLQELFGWPDTPRLAGGRAPVLLHLLAPNFRPVQVTDDLKNFWATTYFQVRKDLRARYPKHSWPDDPLAAKAESKGGRKR